mmetsp:Transcript_31995/g.42393  ORF Transcript_31995/g.42393 Transcript_31995/m.42393 type:complete len:81 (+) Transcript_31995:3-245(+)
MSKNSDKSKSSSFKVPETSAPIKLPKFSPGDTKLRDGTYIDRVMIDYVQTVPPIVPDFALAGEHVIHGSIDEVWEILFDN